MPLPDGAVRPVLRGDTTDELPALVASVKRLVENLERMTALLGSEDDAKKVIDAIDRVNRLLASLDGVALRFDGLSKKVDAVLAEAQGIATDTRAATADLHALRAEIEASLRKAGQLIDEINRKWPFERDTELRLP